MLWSNPIVQRRVASEWYKEARIIDTKLIEAMVSAVPNPRFQVFPTVLPRLKDPLRPPSLKFCFRPRWPTQPVLRQNSSTPTVVSSTVASIQQLIDSRSKLKLVVKVESRRPLAPLAVTVRRDAAVVMLAFRGSQIISCLIRVYVCLRGGGRGCCGSLGVPGTAIS